MKNENKLEEILKEGDNNMTTKEQIEWLNKEITSLERELIGQCINRNYKKTRLEMCQNHLMLLINSLEEQSHNS